MWFYSVIVIIDLLVAIGVYLLNVVLWIMKRVLYKHEIVLIIICLEFCFP